MANRVERAAAGAVRGWIIGITVVATFGWFALMGAGAVISADRPAFWLPTALLAALIVPNFVLVRHALSRWRLGGPEEDRSGLPLILFALVVAAAAYLVGVGAESAPGDTFRLVAAGWGTVVFFGQILFLRGFPASDPPM